MHSGHFKINNKSLKGYSQMLQNNFLINLDFFSNFGPLRRSPAVDRTLVRAQKHHFFSQNVRIKGTYTLPLRRCPASADRDAGRLPYIDGIMVSKTQRPRVTRAVSHRALSNVPIFRSSRMKLICVVVPCSPQSNLCPLNRRGCLW